MSGFTYLMDGVDLGRWRIMRGTSFRAPVSTRRNALVIPGRHGHVSVGMAEFSAPTVLIEFAPTVGAFGGGETLDELTADLAAALAAPLPAPLVRESEGERTEALGELVSLTPDNRSWRPGKRLRLTAEYELPGVFWRDLESRDLPVPAGVSTIADAGSAPVTDAVVRFAAGASHPSLVDGVSGTSIHVERTMTAGRYCFVDVGSLRAWSSTSSSAWAGGTDESQYLSYGPAGPLQLWPIVSQPSRDVEIHYDRATGLVTATGAEITHHGDGRYRIGDVTILSDGRGRVWFDTEATVRSYRVDASHAAVIRVRRAWL